MGIIPRYTFIYLAALITIIFLCVSTMIMMHEKHYRDRRVIIDPNLKIEDRLSNVEKILLEDRYT